MNPRFGRYGALFRSGCINNQRSAVFRRTLLAAPRSGDGPLLERRGDRALPEIQASGYRWLKTAPIFLGILVASTLAIFNYQKSSSPVVASTLYSLRTSPKARAYLGDEIYFASKMPWIWGEMNQLHGRINIRFEVKGTKATGTMRFTSRRRSRRGMFETSEWSLTTREGTKIDLLEDGEPFQMLDGDDNDDKVVGRGLYAPKIDK